MNNIQAAGLAAIHTGYGYYNVSGITGVSDFLPDSNIFDMGIRHERARVLQLLEQRLQDLSADKSSGWHAYRRRITGEALRQVITSILEAE